MDIVNVFAIFNLYNISFLLVNRAPDYDKQG